MIFSTIVALTDHLTRDVDKLSLLHAPFLLGLVTGGAVIYWFTGASMQAVTTGAYRAVEYIKQQHPPGRGGEGVGGRFQEGGGDLHAVCAEGDDQYFSGGVLLDAGVCVYGAILLYRVPGVDRGSSACIRRSSWRTPGGAWDKRQEDCGDGAGKAKGDAAARCDHRGGYKWAIRSRTRSSVAAESDHQVYDAFGLLAVEPTRFLWARRAPTGKPICHVLAGVCLVIALFFVHRSFFGMRIGGNEL